MTFQHVMDDFFSFPLVSHNSPILKGINKSFALEDFFTKSPGMPSPDVLEYKDKYTIKIPVAGYKKEDLSVEIDEKKIKITAKKRTKEEQEAKYHMRNIALSGFEWSLGLNRTVDTESIRGAVEDGILTVNIPKRVVEKEKRLLELD